jgi:hypothetical protein
MIDIASEKLLTLNEAARLLPRRRAGRRVHVSCLYRWTVTGCRGAVLESLQVGCTRCTSLEALARFFAVLSSDRSSVPAPNNRCCTRTRRHEHEQAERELASEGV